VYRRALERALGGADSPTHATMPPLMRPIYVLGLPRTGTTLLLNLLAADSRARHLRYWESLIPFAAAQVKRGADSPAMRQKVAIQQVQMTNLLAPKLMSIHNIEPLGPEECMWLLQNTMLSYSFPLMWHIPEYSEWLSQRSEADWEMAYRQYFATLRLIQNTLSGEHWVLKCPLHTPRLATIARLVPDACFIQTYRNVGEVVGSMCSLAHETQRISSDHVDRFSVGKQTVQTLGSWGNNGTTNEEISSKQLVNIHFNTLVNQPLLTMRLIYEKFDIPWTQSSEDAMRNWLARNSKSKHRKHKYSLSDFGLTPDEVIISCHSYHATEQQLSQHA
jgi:hypothetical protein